MESLVLALRLLLAGVFATAGVAKLRDADGSRRALEDFGVSARLSRPGGVLLPLVEIAIAAALLFPPSARWGALAGVGLLATFVVAIANAMAHGRAPDCHCFGQLHSEPAGRSTLVRNAVLIAVAGTVAAAGPGPAMHTWVGDRSVPELVLLALVLGAVALVARPLYKWSERRLQQRRESRLEAAELPSGLPVGSPAPDFTLPDLRGEQRTLEALCAAGRPVMLVFVHPECGVCHSLLGQLAEWRARLATQITIAVLSEGSADDNSDLPEQHGIYDALLQEHGGQVYHAYELRYGTPAAVVVDPDRKIASVGVLGPLAVEELIRLTLSRTELSARPTVAA